MFATARDWAKFGQLFLNEGKWPGGEEAKEQTEILTADWVRYARSPAPASGHRYGAQWWLNPFAAEDQGSAACNDPELVWQREVPKARTPALRFLPQASKIAYAVALRRRIPIGLPVSRISS